MKFTVIDSDVFLIDSRYSNDVRFKANGEFLESVRQREVNGATTIFNVLEVCGVLSFNLSSKNLLDAYRNFTDEYKIKILFPANAHGDLLYNLPEVFSSIQKKQSLGDAQISFVLERFANQVDAFVTWNKAHFEGKIPMKVVTPEEMLGIS
ncbi:MAG TPA: hypothetical protein DDW49_10610 [Deltaproteobacteria bacterium]|nr:hypothetical protein [Deltaproteobacteria bacterium]